MIFLSYKFFYHDEYAKYCPDCRGSRSWMTGWVLWIQKNTDSEGTGLQKKNGKSERN